MSNNELVGRAKEDCPDFANKQIEGSRIESADELINRDIRKKIGFFNKGFKQVSRWNLVLFIVCLIIIVIVGLIYGLKRDWVIMGIGIGTTLVIGYVIALAVRAENRRNFKNKMYQTMRMNQSACENVGYRSECWAKYKTYKNKIGLQ